MATHVPVMAERVARLMLDSGGECFVDCTLGGGGHSAAIFDMATRPVRIYGIDLDSTALKSAEQRFDGYKGFFTKQGNFADLADLSAQLGLDQVDGILADFGLSSLQLDDPLRGFAHRLDGPLDLRYDQSSGITAADLVNSLSRYDLLHIIKTYGEERRAAQIASEIIRNRPLERTTQLADIVRKICAGKYVEKSLARVFMAFRIAINKDLDAIDKMLPSALELLRPGGRLVIISYDSSQDRRVKLFFRHHAQSCSCPPTLSVCVCDARAELTILTKKPIRPERDEIMANPRSRSGKLRAAEKK